MNIQYIWQQKSNDPNEIDSITMKSEAVPRIGDTVNISIDISKKETVVKIGIVKDVAWYVRKKSYVCVYL